MPREESKLVYKYEELDDRAKEKARDWYRQVALDYDYEDAATVGGFLGIDLRQKPVKLMGGGRRLDPEIYFSGFGHQGQGSSYSATWRAKDIKTAKLEEYAPQDTELQRLAEEFVRVATAFPSASATVRPSCSVYVDLNYDESDYADEEVAIHHGIRQTASEEALEEALRDFNHWIFQQLKSEYEWRMEDKQVEEDIQANEYEFNEDGTIA